MCFGLGRAQGSTGQHHDAWGTLTRAFDYFEDEGDVAMAVAVEAGELTPEEGRERYEAARQALGERGEGGDDQLREFQRSVIERAMAEAPEEWSDEMKAAIVRAGWDLDEFTEGIRQRQAAGTQVTALSQILIDLTTSIEESSWGQIKKDAIEGK